MKTTVLVIILTCGCIVSTYSQLNQNRKRDVTADNLPRFPYNIKPDIGPEEVMKQNGFQGNNEAVQFFLNNRHVTSRTEVSASVRESMPCYKPEGNFSGIIITPDTTTRYTILIKE